MHESLACKNKLLIFLLTSILVACETSSSETATKSSLSEKATQAIHPDTLREKYFNYLNAQNDPLPVSRILEAGKVYPVDEAPADTAFFVFRESLKETLKNKDAFGLMRIVADGIDNGQGTDKGTLAFVQHWGLDNNTDSPDSPVWAALGTLLDKGGIFTRQGKSFEAPYSTACLPDSYQPTAYGIVTGSGVRARAQAGTDAPVVYKLSHAIVAFLGFTESQTTLSGETHPWAYVRYGEQNGYVFGKYFTRPLDRATFTQTPDGNWELSTFYIANQH